MVSYSSVLTAISKVMTMATEEVLGIGNSLPHGEDASLQPWLEGGEVGLRTHLLLVRLGVD